MESLDTSTIEFQNLFQEFIDDLLNDEEKKLVIVLDNLDRLPSKEGAEVWPVLRSFIDNPAFSKAPWAKRLWVLIPYSRDALTAGEKEQDDGSATQAGAPTKPDDEVMHQAADPHFLDKVFQISIFVPPPVLSNWRNYLEKLLREAFGKECDAEISHIIYSLFVRSYSAHTTPGPREIKNIINSMITTAMQWPTDIPLTHHAYFAILKHGRRVDGLRVLLLSRKILLHPDLLGEKIEESLVALEYNVPRQLASQMLYEPLIRRIFSDDLHHSDLLERCTDPGFAAQFDILIGEVLKSNAANPILLVQNMALLCCEDFIEKITISSKRNVIREISKAIEKLQHLPLNLPNLVDSIEVLAKADDERLVSINLSKAIERTITYYSAEENAVVFGFADRHLGSRSVLETAFSLKSSYTIQAYTKLEKEIAFRFPGNVEAFLSAEKHFRNGSIGELLDTFEFSSVADRLTDEIVFKRSESRRLSEVVEILRYLSGRKTKIPSKTFSDIVSRMIRDRSIGYDSIRFALPYFFGLQSENSAVKEALNKPTVVDFSYYYLGIYNPRLPENLAFQEGDAWLISTMLEQEKIVTCARLIYLLLINQESTEREQKNGYSLRGKKLYERVIAKPERHPLIVKAVYRLAKDDGNFTFLQENVLSANLNSLHAMLASADQTFQ